MRTTDLTQTWGAHREQSSRTRYRGKIAFNALFDALRLFALVVVGSLLVAGGLVASVFIYTTFPS